LLGERDQRYDHRSHTLGLYLQQPASECLVEQYDHAGGGGRVRGLRYGISVGVNVTNSAINATIRNVNGYGIRDTAQIPEANTPQGNRYHISTSRCQLGGYYIEGINGVWNIISQLDGRVGAQGSSFAVDLYGSGNVFTVTGNTGIATITPIASVKGRMVILLFTGTSIVTNSTGNLKLSGNFITTPNSTLTLLWDGTNFVETGRSLK